MKRLSFTAYPLFPLLILLAAVILGGCDEMDPTTPAQQKESAQLAPLAPGETDAEGFVYESTDPESSLPDASAEVTAAELSAESLTPVDLQLWTPESYPQVSGFPSALWVMISNRAEELNNAQPTVLFSDFSALWTALEVDVYTDNADDDYIGFAVGFQSGDTSNPSADYLLVDWKRGTQWFDFGIPSCTPGSTAPAGLAASHVFGVPTADEFWGHTNFDASCSDLNNGLAELARGNTLGNTGWWYDWIHFRFEYTSTNLKVYVNGNLEIDIGGAFGNGSWAFYNFSQASTHFRDAAVERLPRPVDIDIKPGSYPNSINPGSNGLIPVAILTTPDFDATSVDPDTVMLEGVDVAVRGKAEKLMSHEEDVDEDGDTDLVVQIETEELPDTLQSGDACLTAFTYDGCSIKGCDEITVVPPE